MDDSPLARLPPELRNRIYKFVLTQSTEICIISANPPSRRTRLKHPDLHKNAISLLRTCKMAKEECSQLFYACNSFTFMPTEAYHGYDALAIWSRFRDEIGEGNQQALRDVAMIAGGRCRLVGIYDSRNMTIQREHLQCMIQGIANEAAPSTRFRVITRAMRWVGLNLFDCDFVTLEIEVDASGASDRGSNQDDLNSAGCK